MSYKDLVLHKLEVLFDKNRRWLDFDYHTIYQINAVKVIFKNYGKHLLIKDTIREAKARCKRKVEYVLSEE